MEKKTDLSQLGLKNPMVDRDLLNRYAELTRHLPNRPSRSGAAYTLKRAFSERRVDFRPGRPGGKYRTR